MLASISLTERLITRRPKPCRSAKPGWAPIETPFWAQSFTVSIITTGSLAWKPQARLADRTTFSISASLPITQGPKLSPRSELMLTCPTFVVAMADSLDPRRYPSRRERPVPLLRRYRLYRRIRQRNFAWHQWPGHGPARRDRRGQGGRPAGGGGRDGADHALADGHLRPSEDLPQRTAARDRRPDRGRPLGRGQDPQGHHPLLLRRRGVRARPGRCG